MINPLNRDLRKVTQKDIDRMNFNFYPDGISGGGIKIGGARNRLFNARGVAF